VSTIGARRLWAAFEVSIGVYRQHAGGACFQARGHHRACCIHNLFSHPGALNEVARALPDTARLPTQLLADRLELGGGRLRMAGKASEPF